MSHPARSMRGESLKISRRENPEPIECFFSNVFSFAELILVLHRISLHWNAVAFLHHIVFHHPFFHHTFPHHHVPFHIHHFAFLHHHLLATFHCNFTVRCNL